MSHGRAEHGFANWATGRFSDRFARDANKLRPARLAETANTTSSRYRTANREPNLCEAAAHGTATDAVDRGCRVMRSAPDGQGEEE